VPAFSSVDKRWRLLMPPGIIVVRVRNRSAVVAQIRALPSGTQVAFVGGRRLRWLAWRTRVRVSASYVALPSLETPVAIAKVAPESLRWTARSILTVPSGTTRLHAPLWAAVRVVSAVPGLLAFAPGGDRILIGVRT
jgi:hypothetical protein